MTTTYYQNHKEKLRKEVCKRYQNLSKDEEDKKRKKASERYENFTEEKKKKA